MILKWCSLTSVYTTIFFFQKLQIWQFIFYFLTFTFNMYLISTLMSSRQFCSSNKARVKMDLGEHFQFPLFFLFFPFLFVCLLKQLHKNYQTEFVKTCCRVKWWAFTIVVFKWIDKHCLQLCLWMLLDVLI